MLADEFRCAITAASRDRLTTLSATLWQAFATGALSEADASELSLLIEVRKAVPAETAPRRGRAARPRDPVHVERRRKWVASGWLPNAVAARFTVAETAALAVVAWRVAKEGRCALPIDRIASLAGVSRTKVKDAIRLARSLGLLTVEERRRSRGRSDTNVVRLACRTWRAWLDGIRGPRLKRGLRPGVGKQTAFSTEDSGRGFRRGQEGGSDRALPSGLAVGGTLKREPRP